MHYISTSERIVSPGDMNEWRPLKPTDLHAVMVCGGASRINGIQNVKVRYGAKRAEFITNSLIQYAVDIVLQFYNEALAGVGCRP